MSWKEKINMENFEIGRESIQTSWSSLLTEALYRKHYLATKALLRLSDTIYETEDISASSTTDNNNMHNSHFCDNATQDNDGTSEKVTKTENESLSFSTKKVLKETRFSYFTVLAVQTNNVKLVRLLLTHQFGIEWPHLLDCHCWLCENDKFGQAKRRIETLQALSNPLWLNMNCDDPFLTSFKIMKKCRRFRSQQDCYEKEYDLITKQNLRFCTGLLDQVRDENEVRCLMRWNDVMFEPFKNVKSLAFIRLGFKYDIKEVRINNFHY